MVVLSWGNHFIKTAKTSHFYVGGFSIPNKTNLEQEPLSHGMAPHESLSSGQGHVLLGWGK